MKISRFLCVSALAGAAVAAPPSTAPEDLALRTVRVLAAQDRAVLRVGERLIVAGRGFCATTSGSAGMVVQLPGQYGAAYRAAARTELGIVTGPTVTAVADGGAAARAGLGAGDAIVSIDGVAVARPSAAAGKRGSFAPTAAVLDAIEAASGDGRVEFGIVRAGRSLTIAVEPTPACRARFDVRAGSANNANADGTTVQVASDLVDQVRGDGELATILAHELAHNILRHPQRLKGPRPRPSVRATEIEADRLSVYLLDAAGYPIAAAVAFWSRWGRSNSYGIFSDPSHPRWRERVRIIEAEAAAIAAQRAAGGPVRAPADLAPVR